MRLSSLYTGSILLLVGTAAFFSPASFSSSTSEQKSTGHIVSEITPEGLQTLIKKALSLATKFAPGHFEFKTEAARKEIDLGVPAQDSRWGTLVPLVQVLTGVNLRDSHKIQIALTKQELIGDASGDLTRIEFKPLDVHLRIANKSAWIRVGAVRATTDLGFNDVTVKLLSASSDKAVFRLATQFNSLDVSIPEVRFCETGGCNKQKENVGTLKNIRLKKVSGTADVRLSADVELRKSNGILVLNLQHVRTNLNTKNSPRFDLSFGEASLPPVTLTIGDTTLTANPEVLRQIIEEQTQALADAFVTQIGDSMTGRLTERLQKLMSGLQLPSQVQYGNDPIDAPYSVLGVTTPILASDNTQVRNPRIQALHSLGAEPESMFKTILEKIRFRMLTDGSAILGLGSVSQNEQGALRIEVAPELRMGSSVMSISPVLGYGKYRRDYKNLSSKLAALPSNHHFIFALSEPVINGALTVGLKSGLVSRILRDSSGICKTFGPEGVKFHFVTQNRKPQLVAIANLILDLTCESKLGTLAESWSKFWSGQGRTTLKFPIEIRMNPILTVDGKTGNQILKFEMESPIRKDAKGDRSFVNSYGYPLEMPYTEVVRSGVFDSIEESIVESLKDPFEIDLTDVLKESGWNIQLQQVRVESSGHFVVVGRFE